MILLIDNYDSFSYNLYQLIGSIEPDIKVIRNDEMTVEEIEALAPDKIVISPGPGRPCDSGVSMAVIRKMGEHTPILGVCLGHQAIVEAFGGTVSYAKKIMHGKTSVINVNTMTTMFKGMDGRIKVGRYHSLAAVKGGMPPGLTITAADDDGEIMAVEHKKFPVFGLQFHPESILTPDGEKLIKNFLEVKAND